MVLAQQRCVLRLRLLQNTNKPNAGSRTGQRGAGSGRNGNEDVAGVASEAFARWLHHPQYPHVPVEPPSVRRAIPCLLYTQSQ